MNRGNLNSEIGLPLSVFEVKDEHKYAVFEMGMNRPGEMDVLTEIVRPETALITNIGAAHIGFLGSKAKIAEEKKKILLSLEPRGRGFIYEKDEYFSFLLENVVAEVLPFGEKTTIGLEAVEDRGLGGWDLRFRGETVHFPLVGVHNLRNALGAVSLCSVLGVSPAVMKEGLEAVKPLFGRGRIFRGEITIIEDCYNANPDSMASALEFLRTVSWKGRKVALLASMKELGDLGAAAHGAVGESLADGGLDAVFFYGPEMELAFARLKSRGFAGFFRHYADLDLLLQDLRGFLREGDLVLAKGSRSMEMERVTEAIRKVRV
jgi:UDP-N-acetylmuramoyl-tripeptide--D-alanyl-D-alanine ligase